MEQDWKNRYTPPENSIWKGREGEAENSRLFSLVQCVDLLAEKLVECDGYAFGFLGFSCDEGVRRNQGRCGADEGPAALREALASQPLHLTKPCSFFDFGDITCTDGNLEDAQRSLGMIIEHIHLLKIKPIILGGGHEISWGHYQGILSAFEETNCGIVNFDAHFDLRPPIEDGKGSSGTPFFQIAQQLSEEEMPFNYLCMGIQKQSNTAELFQTAQDLSVQYVTAEEIHNNHHLICRQAIDKIVKKSDNIYLTICLDAFASCFAPGVSAPQAQGLTPWQVSPLIEYLVSSGKVVSFDVAEMCPRLDQDKMTARLAASLISTYFHAAVKQSTS
ncbi:MAG: formiminoglutamase [Chlamydiales bacterium]|jgi:formiminoglutamase